MQQELNVYQLSRAIESIFGMYDKNLNGYLEDQQLMEYLKEAIHVKKRVTKSQINDFLGAFDQNGDGKISKQEFMKFLKSFF